MSCISFCLSCLPVFSPDCLAVWLPGCLAVWLSVFAQCISCLKRFWQHAEFEGGSWWRKECCVICCASSHPLFPPWLGDCRRVTNANVTRFTLPRKQLSWWGYLCCLFRIFRALELFVVFFFWSNLIAVIWMRNRWQGGKWVCCLKCWVIVSTSGLEKLSVVQYPFLFLFFFPCAFPGPRRRLCCVCSVL